MSKFTVYMRAELHRVHIIRLCAANEDKFSHCRRVKHSLVSETFNIVGFHPPHGLVSKHQVPKR